MRSVSGAWLWAVPLIVVLAASFGVTHPSELVGSTLWSDSGATSRGARIHALLLGEPLRPVTLQAALLLLLFGWKTSQRFGPAPRPMARRGRNMTAHAEALGRNLHKARRDRKPHS